MGDSHIQQTLPSPYRGGAKVKMRKVKFAAHESVVIVDSRGWERGMEGKREGRMQPGIYKSFIAYKMTALLEKNRELHLKIMKVFVTVHSGVWKRGGTEEGKEGER